MSYMDTAVNSTDIKASALELIGNTPLVALDRIWPGPGRLLAKCEFMNPGGSIKDRPAYGMIKKALESGKLKPGGPVVELTGGNTGSGLAVVCGVLGHPLTVTMSKGNTIERATMMRALGAEVHLVDQVEGTPGNVTGADVQAAREKCEAIAKETGAFYVDQFHNPDHGTSHEETTGPEIFRQTGGKVDAFCAMVGTGGTFSGISKYLKKVKPEVQCFAVEPEGSEPIKGCDISKPRHLLEGAGFGSVPGMFRFETMDGTVSVNDQEAVEYRKLLAKKEGLYVGYTSGANVAAAVKLLKSGELGDDPWIVTVLVDTGLKYPEVEKYPFES